MCIERARKETRLMVRLVMVIASLAVLMGAVPAAFSETMDDLVKELGLNDFQIMQIRMLFEGFARKQAGTPSVGNIAMNNRPLLKEVITGTPFNEQKARELGQKVGALYAQKVVDRLLLRNQVFRVLTPEQQDKYMSMVQEAVADAQLIQ